MMRPVILSRPEKLAFLLTIFAAGGSLHDLVARLQARRRLRHALRLALSRRQPRQRIGRAAAAARATAGRHVLRDHGRARRRRQRLRLHGPGMLDALPRQRPVGGGSTRPCGSAGTSSSSSWAAGWLPRGMLPGGRGTGSEKIVPIPARARGGASEIAMAAIRAAKPVRTMVRNISRGFNGRIGLTTLYRDDHAARRAPVNTLITAGKGRLSPASCALVSPPAK